MIKLFMSTSCISCKKVLNFFEENNIELISIKIEHMDITVQDLKDMLVITDNGVEDIIASKRKQSGSTISIDDMTIDQLCNHINKEKNLLKRPIVLQYRNGEPKRIMVGYNSDEIEIFLRDKHREELIKSKLKHIQ